MNKKQYFFLTLLLSCCAHQFVQTAARQATRLFGFPVKTLIVLGASSGFFGFEVAKNKERAAQLPDDRKTPLQRTYPLTDATLQTTSELLTKSAYALALAAMRVEVKRNVLLDEIEAFGKKVTDSVKLTNSNTEATIPAPTHSQESTITEPAQADSQTNAQTILEAAGYSSTPVMETSTDISTTLPATTNEVTASEALQVLAPATAEAPVTVAPLINE